MPCVICNETPASSCGSCNSSACCSKKCQQLDWPLHKTLCKKLARLLTARPQPSSKLGILLRAEDPSRASSGAALEKTICLYARDNWPNDGSKPKQAALALTDWELPYDWSRIILIMSHAEVVGRNLQPPPKSRTLLTMSVLDEGGQLEPFRDFQDVTLGDLRTAVDYLSRYGMVTQRGTENSSLNITQADKKAPKSKLQKMMEKMMASQAEEVKKTKFKGVLIRCAGKISLLIKQSKKAERYGAVEMAKDHPLLSSVLNLYQTDTPFIDAEWGFPPPTWQSQIGSVLLVRQDGKELTCKQARALAEYMQHHVPDSFEEALESEEEKQRRSQVLKTLNWTAFDSFWTASRPGQVLPRGNLGLGSGLILERGRITLGSLSDEGCQEGL
ncbi:uncharacterized protein L3040_003165 [Drepanopeziza brunnea f. sp. 'multigermtubi']|uniref:uncharacterized protein n=1 Tax=Drepanopeziza brunnea f. sp. 'multigermtubi' TaxID=698441 RepID=UPI002386144E|nr:hypothetical protein L3040_003165 [Drepanopeziza brunnea f. sp. 'multigermtubi']